LLGEITDKQSKIYQALEVEPPSLWFSGIQVVSISPSFQFWAQKNRLI